MNHRKLPQFIVLMDVMNVSIDIKVKLSESHGDLLSSEKGFNYDGRKQRADSVAEMVHLKNRAHLLLPQLHQPHIAPCNDYYAQGYSWIGGSY